MSAGTNSNTPSSIWSLSISKCPQKSLSYLLTIPTTVPVGTMSYAIISSTYFFRLLLSFWLIKDPSYYSGKISSSSRLNVDNSFFFKLILSFRFN